MPKCPYDPTHDNTTQPHKRGASLYCACQSCGRMARARIHSRVDGSRYYSLSLVGRKSIGDDVKRVRTFRASDAEMNAVERGALRLIVRNNRVTVSA